jgi:hypothetical protein
MSGSQAQRLVADVGVDLDLVLALAREVPLESGRTSERRREARWRYRSHRFDFDLTQALSEATLLAKDRCSPAVNTAHLLVGLLLNRVGAPRLALELAGVDMQYMYEHAEQYLAQDWG